MKRLIKEKKGIYLAIAVVVSLCLLFGSSCAHEPELPEDKPQDEAVEPAPDKPQVKIDDWNIVPEPESEMSKGGLAVAPRNIIT